MVFALLPVTAFVRLWCISNSDLPSGDEINTYIFNAQRFASFLSIPTLDNFPLTAVVYGTLISIIDQFSVTLSGVVAGNILSVLAGIICVYFTHRGVAKASDEKMGIVAAVAVALFPGTLFAFRADLSLYYIFMPVLSFSFISLAEKPCYRRAVIPGIIGALFYMSRSDGIFIFFISAFLFPFYYKALFKMSIVAVLTFVFIMSCYWGIEYTQKGRIGGGAKNRAIAAFYQAEGIHDGRGGDWHEYTQRGIERFGPQKEYKNSIFLLIFKNSDAVYERLIHNLQIIATYLEKSSTPIWLAVLLLLPALLGRYRKIVILFALPCIATSCIYLAFYFQISYFTLLSFGLAITFASGVLTVIETTQKITNIANSTERQTNIAVSVVITLLVVALVYHTLLLHPQRRTSADRYWDALTMIKERCQNASSNCFFTPPYRGSLAMPIFANLPFARVDYGPLSALPQKEQRQFLVEHDFKYLLCGREHHSLWQNDPMNEDVIFANDRNDVKIVAFSLSGEFSNSSSSYFRITSANGVSSLTSLHQLHLQATVDSIAMEALGVDSFALLPSIQTFDSPIVAMKVTVQSPVDTSLRIYFKNQSDPDYAEHRSVAKKIQKGMNTIYLALPVGRNSKSMLRLDPGTEPGIYRFYSLEARAI